MKLVRNLKISQKFILVLALLSGAMLTVGLVGLSGLGSLHKSSGGLNQAVRETELDASTRALATRAGQQAFQVIAAPDPATIKVRDAELASTIRQVNGNFATMERLYAKRPVDLALTRRQEAPWRKFLALRDAKAFNFLAPPAQFLKMQSRVVDQVRPLLDELTAAAGELAARDVKLAGEANASATSQYHGKRTLMLIALLLGIAAGAGVVFLLIRNIVPRVKEYGGFAGTVAAGDLTARVTPKGGDELTALAESLNEMVEKLATMNGRMQENAHAVSTSASEILATVTQQTAGANQQSAAINETTTATEEIRASAEQAARNADTVAGQAQDAVRTSEEGTQAVEAIVAGMDEIRDKVAAIAGDVQALSDQTAQIGEITSAVNDLADQSNLLALNATIEAARAGEQGKGFAVVADEVRNLAEQSKQATAQVQTILEDIERATRAAVSAAQDGTEVVERGSQLAQRAGEIIAELASTNLAVGQSAQQIAASVQQQNAGMDQIAQGMVETSQAATEFVAGVQQSQTAAEGLDRVAAELKDLAAQYKV
jgi:methyl-accepting chemotaxis protein